MAFDEVKAVWVSGQLVPWREANAHVSPHALHSGVSEAIRCYETPEGPAVFRLDEHIEQFFQSAGSCGIRIPFTRREMRAAVCQIVGANGLTSCYVRPTAYLNGRVETTVVAWPWPSSTARTFSEPADGNAPGQTLFVVRGGVLSTTEASLPMTTVACDAVATIARDLGYRVKTTSGEDDELEVAAEVFTVGAAADVTPVTVVDGVTVGDGTAGPVTRLIQNTLDAVTSGRDSQYRQWLHFVDDCMLAGAFNAASCI